MLATPRIPSVPKRRGMGQPPDGADVDGVTAGVTVTVTVAGLIARTVRPASTEIVSVTWWVPTSRPATFADTVRVAPLSSSRWAGEPPIVTWVCPIDRL